MNTVKAEVPATTNIGNPTILVRKHVEETTADTQESRDGRDDDAAQYRPYRIEAELHPAEGKVNPGQAPPGDLDAVLRLGSLLLDRLLEAWAASLAAFLLAWPLGVVS